MNKPQLALDIINEFSDQAKGSQLFGVEIEEYSKEELEALLMWSFSPKNPSRANILEADSRQH